MISALMAVMWQTGHKLTLDDVIDYLQAEADYAEMMKSTGSQSSSALVMSGEGKKSKGKGK